SFARVVLQCRDTIHDLAAAVVPPSGIPFGVLVREDRSGRLEDGLADEVLRRDQLEARRLARPFVGDRRSDLGVDIAEPGWDRGGRGHGGGIVLHAATGRSQNSWLIESSLSYLHLP